MNIYKCANCKLVLGKWWHKKSEGLRQIAFGHSKNSPSNSSLPLSLNSLNEMLNQYKMDLKAGLKMYSFLDSKEPFVDISTECVFFGDIYSSSVHFCTQIAFGIHLPISSLPPRHPFLL